MTHTIIISYTNSDDGIWLVCSCFNWSTGTGWRKNIGFEPELTTANQEAESHLAKVSQ